MDRREFYSTLALLGWRIICCLIQAEWMHIFAKGEYAVDIYDHSTGGHRVSWWRHESARQ